MSSPFATEQYYRFSPDVQKSQIPSMSGWTPRIRMPLDGLPSPRLNEPTPSGRLHAPRGFPVRRCPVPKASGGRTEPESAQQDCMKRSGWSPRMNVRMESPAMSTRSITSHSVLAESDSTFQALPDAPQQFSSERFVNCPEDCAQQGRQGSGKQLNMKITPLQLPSSSSSNGGYGGALSSPWLLKAIDGGRQMPITPSTSEEDASSQDELFPSSDLSSSEGSPVIYEMSPVGHLDGMICQTQANHIAVPTLGLLKQQAIMKQNAMGKSMLPVKSRRPSASALRSPSTASLSTAESGGSNGSADELAVRAKSLANGSGSWAKAYQTSSGDRRDALRFLCMSGVVTTRELNDDAMTFTDDHIDQCVTIAQDMLATLPYEVWIRKPKEACKVFEDKYREAHSPKYTEKAVFQSLGIGNISSNPSCFFCARFE